MFTAKQLVLPVAAILALGGATFLATGAGRR